MKSSIAATHLLTDPLCTEAALQTWSHGLGDGLFPARAVSAGARVLDVARRADGDEFLRMSAVWLRALGEVSGCWLREEFAMAVGSSRIGHAPPDAHHEFACWSRGELLCAREDWASTAPPEDADATPGWSALPAISDAAVGVLVTVAQHDVLATLRAVTAMVEQERLVGWMHTAARIMAWQGRERGRLLTHDAVRLLCALPGRLHDEPDADVVDAAISNEVHELYCLGMGCSCQGGEVEGV